MSGRTLLSISRATGAGAVAGATALVLMVGYTFWPEVFVLPYVAALSVTAGCGVYILLATLFDSYRNPRRGTRIRPIRGFDIAVGVLLTLVAGWMLRPFLPAL